MAKINCPNCKKELIYQNIKDIPNFPFCSSQCKLTDLGAWLDGRHRIEEPMSPEILNRIGEEGEESG